MTHMTQKAAYPGGGTAGDGELLRIRRQHAHGEGQLPGLGIVDWLAELKQRLDHAAVTRHVHDRIRRSSPRTRKRRARCGVCEGGCAQQTACGQGIIGRWQNILMFKCYITSTRDCSSGLNKHRLHTERVA